MAEKWENEAEPLARPRPFFLNDQPHDEQQGELMSPLPSADASGASRQRSPQQRAPPSAYGDIISPTPISPAEFGYSITGESSRPETPGQHTPSHMSFPDFSGLTTRSSSAARFPDFKRGSAVSTSATSVREAFASPPTRPVTGYASTAKIQRSRMRSTLLQGDTVEKPWLDGSGVSTARMVHLLTYGVMFLGVIGGFFICFFGYRSVPMIQQNLCLKLDEQWDGDDDALFGPQGRWLREVQMDGFGNGEFEMTTSSSNNSFIRNGNLYILPTLTSDAIGNDAIYDGYIFNATACTYNTTRDPHFAFNQAAYLKACSATSNLTAGTIINPIQSARLSTKLTTSIQYGKVEVRAKLPRGDWLWPAIWMLPVDNAYGPWPLSGEIDLMEARGNTLRYPLYGYNAVRGALHWGPLTFLDRVWMTWGLWRLRHSTFADDFHTYTLEWTPKFLRVYVDTRLHFMLDLRFDQRFFHRGNFPSVVQNGSDYITLQDPWATGGISAPFDQKFYLILNVAVGGTNGWFPDGLGQKPWLDWSQFAMRDFARNQDKWYPTWPESEEDRAMIVDSVKMWELC